MIARSYDVKPFVKMGEPYFQIRHKLKQHGIVVFSSNYAFYVEPTPAHRTAEVESIKTMIERVGAPFDIKPERLIGDTVYGTAPMMAWMVNEKDIEAQVPIWDKTERKNADTMTIRTPIPRPSGQFQAGSDAALFTTIDLFSRSEEVVVERLSMRKI